ncbi:acyltransferase family protein, partial [Candidatus Latescibacterota bacterium]
MKPQRQYNLDWLRVLVIINIIPYHAAWLVSLVRGFSHNPQNTLGAHVLRYYIYFFPCIHMHLLFFIAGVSAGLALTFRSTGDFIKERIKRLLVPLLFFMVFCAPVLSYFWHDKALVQSFSHFVFHYWPDHLTSLHYNDFTRGPRWAHMWFVAYLLIYS